MHSPLLIVCFETLPKGGFSAESQGCYRLDELACWLRPPGRKRASSTLALGRLPWSGASESEAGRPSEVGVPQSSWGSSGLSLTDCPQPGVGNGGVWDRKMPVSQTQR